jgi:hypothetical protein
VADLRQKICLGIGSIHAVEALRVQSGVRKASTSQLWPLVGIISDLTYEGVGSGPEPTSRLDLAVA